MILTVTPNTALDLTLIYDRFTPGGVQRASATALSTAGKAVDASYVLGALGVPSLATGFAAGLFGQKLVELLESRGATPDFVWVQGETRINTILIERETGLTSTLTSDSLVISEADQAALLDKVQRHAAPGRPLITGGSLPFSLESVFYARMLRLAREGGSPVIFDGSGDNLQAGLPERPTVIKPNQQELSGFTGSAIRDAQDALGAARQIFAQYGVSVVATLGAQGAVAVFPEGSYRLHPPIVAQVVSAAGAGDAMLAGLAIALASGRPLVEGLVLGAAASAAVLLTPGTADCRKEDVLRFLGEVRVEEAGLS